MPGIKTDMFELGYAIANGDMSAIDIKVDNKSRVAIAGVSLGYPGDYGSAKSKQIFGLEYAMRVSGVQLYGAGVRVENGRYYANGGRLFYIVGEGSDIMEAREKAYHAMSLVSMEGDKLHYRKNIGWRDVARLKRE